MNINDLPNEILSHIFSRDPAPNLVCKKWYGTNEDYWKTLAKRIGIAFTEVDLTFPAIGNVKHELGIKLYWRALTNELHQAISEKAIKAQKPVESMMDFVEKGLNEANSDRLKFLIGHNTEDLLELAAGPLNEATIRLVKMWKEFCDFDDTKALKKLQKETSSGAKTAYTIFKESLNPDELADFEERFSTKS